jgi:two-component system, response regulator
MTGRPSPARPSPARRILIAEDNPDDAQLAIDALREVSPGLHIDVVRDGAEMLENLGRAKGASTLPDLILLDLRMPRVDGLEALRQIRARPELRHLLVVSMFTSASDTDLVLQSYETGANAFVTKPSSYRRLVELMRGIVTYWFEVATLPTQVAIDARRSAIDKMNDR